MYVLDSFTKIKNIDFHYLYTIDRSQISDRNRVTSDRLWTGAAVYQPIEFLIDLTQRLDKQELQSYLRSNPSQIDIGHERVSSRPSRTQTALRTDVISAPHI